MSPNMLYINVTRVCNSKFKSFSVKNDNNKKDFKPNSLLEMNNKNQSLFVPDSIAVHGGIGSKFKAKHYPHADEENSGR